MPKESKALTSSFCLKLIAQLVELTASEAIVTDKLYRCRQILEELFKALTSSTNVSFTGLYARMQYTYEASVISSELNEQLQLLRLLTNKVVHQDDVEFGEHDFASAVLILFDTIKYLSGSPKPQSTALEEYLKARNAKQLIPFRAASEQTIDHIFGIVTDWKISQAKESNKFIEIIFQTAEGSQIRVTLWEKDGGKNQGRKWTWLDKSLWKYCNISFYNLTPVRGMANRYQSTPMTLAVLEQDFLMDVSSIAECFHNTDTFPELFIMNRFFSDPTNLPLARGKCANFVFDELIADPSRPLQEIFDEYLQSNPMQVFSLGRDTWQEIFKQIELEHYPQLRAIASDLKDKNCQLEPSFISLKYGLHGRLDVITLPETDADKYSIMELKSGSAPSYDAWISHTMQVVGYNLIMKETFGAPRIGNSSIFYSRSIDKPLRYVVNHINQEQDFLMCRNRIIGLLQKLSVNPEIILNWLQNNPRRYPNTFITDKANGIGRTLKSLTASEMKWLISKLKFLFREIWSVKTGAYAENEIGYYGFSSLWNCSLIEKKKQYRIIDNLWIEAVDGNQLTFHRQDEITLTNLRVGDIIVMYKQITPVNEQQLIRGTILSLDDEKIIIRTRSKLKQTGAADKYTLWAIEPDLMETSLYSGLSSLYTFLIAEPEIRAKLLGEVSPEFSELPAPKSLSWRADVSECLAGMISARDYYMVQGPPGTGKTSVLLMQYVGHILSETSEKVLILSFTNRAVDEICGHLDKENFSYIRLGNKAPLPGPHAHKKGKKPSQKAAADYSEDDYLNCRIFIATTHTFLSVAPDLLNKITLDELIVDEASQILEHHVIGLMSKIHKTILIGDQNQLPPIILQHADTEKVSILEKLILNANKKIFPTCYSMLTHHYRMHNEIARLVSDSYDKKLKSDSSRQQVNEPWQKPEDPFLKQVLASRLVWIDTQPSYQSKADTCHAGWVKEFLDKLSQLMPVDEICTRVGIISPFRAQGQCIMSALGKKFHDLTVDTVERYQGSERDCIIMSYPIRYQHELAMLQSINSLGTVDRKLNVALSRAREQLIILGSSKILTYSEFFHKVYDLIKKHGVVISGSDLGIN